MWTDEKNDTDSRMVGESKVGTTVLALYHKTDVGVISTRAILAGAILTDPTMAGSLDVIAASVADMVRRAVQRRWDLIGPVSDEGAARVYRAVHPLAHPLVTPSAKLLRRVMLGMEDGPVMALRLTYGLGPRHAEPLDIESVAGHMGVPRDDAAAFLGEALIYLRQDDTRRRLGPLGTPATNGAASKEEHHG